MDGRGLGCAWCLLVVLWLPGLSGAAEAEGPARLTQEQAVCKTVDGLKICAGSAEALAGIGEADLAQLRAKVAAQAKQSRSSAQADSDTGAPALWCWDRYWGWYLCMW